MFSSPQQTLHWRLKLRRLLILPLLSLALASCATWQLPDDAGDDSLLRQRAVTATVQGIRLNAAVLSAADSRRIFGVNVLETGVQPVWIEVQNSSQHKLWLLRSGTDPDYFSPLEVAWPFHSLLSPKSNARIDDHFDALGFHNPIPPATKQTGILFTNPHHQTRLLNIDLIGHGLVIPFTLFPPVPDDAPDDTGANVTRLLANTPATDYQLSSKFRTALEKMPCCAMGSDGINRGDPLNVVLVGEFSDIGSALVRRNFRKAKLDSDNTQRLFGRTPDIVARKEAQGGASENWIRMWIAPLTYRNQPVFLAQAGRPVGGRFVPANDAKQTLHPKVDEVRNMLIQDLLYSGGLAKLGFVAGVGAATLTQPRATLGGVNYHTDGIRAVLFLETRPLALSEVQILDWEPVLRRSEVRAIKRIEASSQ